jgi:hypothetical protein
LGKRDSSNCCACRLFISIVFFFVFFVIKLHLLTIQFFFKLY